MIEDGSVHGCLPKSVTNIKYFPGKIFNFSLFDLCFHIQTFARIRNRLNLYKSFSN